MRHDREYWSRHVEEWRSGGLTQKGYCERHGLIYGTMNYWTRKLRSREAEADSQRMVELGAGGEDTLREHRRCSDRAGGGRQVSAEAVAR